MTCNTEVFVSPDVNFGHCKEKIMDKCSLTSGIYHLAHFERKSLFFLKWLIGGLSFLTVLFSLFFCSLHKFISMLCFLKSFVQPGCWSHSHKHWLQLFIWLLPIHGPNTLLKAWCYKCCLDSFSETLVQSNCLKLELNFWVMIPFKKIIEYCRTLKILRSYFGIIYGCWKPLCCRMCF